MEAARGNTRVDVGEDVDLVVGIGLNGTYSWTISGAGHYP